MCMFDKNCQTQLLNIAGLNFVKVGHSATSLPSLSSPLFFFTMIIVITFFVTEGRNQQVGQTGSVSGHNHFCHHHHLRHHHHCLFQRHNFLGEEKSIGRPNRFSVRSGQKYNQFGHRYQLTTKCISRNRNVFVQIEQCICQNCIIVVVDNLTNQNTRTSAISKQLKAQL